MYQNKTMLHINQLEICRRQYIRMHVLEPEFKKILPVSFHSQLFRHTRSLILSRDTTTNQESEIST